MPFTMTGDFRREVGAAGTCAAELGGPECQSPLATQREAVPLCPLARAAGALAVLQQGQRGWDSLLL